MYAEYSLWDRLAAADKPIVIYGTGNGADKIINALETYSVKPDAVFASSGFVRNRVFRGYTVRSYEDIVSEYGNDIIVLLAFGTTLDEVCNFIKSLAKKHELYIPDVPLYGGELFDYNYFLAHKPELDAASELLADERSKKLFTDAVNFRLTGKEEYLSDTEPLGTTLSELFSNQKIRSILDCGAFKGDSTELFTNFLHPDVIYAVEADPKSFARLSEYADRENSTRIIPINAVITDRDGTVDYIYSGSRGSGEQGQNKRAKTTEIQALTIDSIAADSTIDFIKLDIEGNEAEALRGATRVFERDLPSVALSVYHRTEDLYSLVLTLHSLLPDHKLYLRRVPCIPMWDLTLYAIKKAEDS